MVPASVVISTTTLAGATTIVDDGLGNLSGDYLDTNLQNTIDYTTGDWVLNFSSAPVAAANNITILFIVVGNGSPIMGINHFEDETTGLATMTVEDQKRMCTFNTTTDVFDPVNTVSQTFFYVVDPLDTATNPATITLPWTKIAPYSITISDGSANTIKDVPGLFPAGGFTSAVNLNNVGGSAINYTTGDLTLNFAAYGAPTSKDKPVTLSITLTLQGDYFNCTNTNFFHFTNWKANDSTSAYLYLTNNIDRITLFDGTNLSRPAFPIYIDDLYDQANGIVHALDVKVYKGRLLIFRPTITGNILEGQAIRWSSLFYTYGTNLILPFDFVADVAGHGGLKDVPTADWIINSEFLRDAIVLFLQRSTWLLRFTGSEADPLRLDQINTSRNANAPYGSLNYDSTVTAMGTKGLIECDGVNVERYDNQVIDLYTDIDNDNFAQCIGARDDIFNQSWMLYPSEARTTGNNFSDKAIIYNFLEKTFATYNINLSCIGVENTFQDITWADFASGSGAWPAGYTWADCNFTWDKFIMQNLTPEIYGGDQNGYVYLLNAGETDHNVHIDVNVASKRWNPFLQQTGERCRVGYIDIYYLINAAITLKIDLYTNNSVNPTKTMYLTCDGPESDDYAWQRLYCNLQGEFIKMNISSPYLYPDSVNLEQDDPIPNDGTWQIIGIIVWAAPAGRLTPGVIV